MGLIYSQSILAMAKALCLEQGVMAWSSNQFGLCAEVNKSNLYRYLAAAKKS
ncbi:MAG: hypothetical protein OXF07_01380 [Rhodobacter sp.]|nr:hypothetical protein [Rhodobacter sp.]MCY4243596.1 hypothetical protein [Rhodobacter sp.]